MKKDIIIPQESYSAVSYLNNNLPAIAVINKPLLKFKAKSNFAYSLCLSIEFKESKENGMPSEKDLVEIEKFENLIHPVIIGDETQPNSLLLARITWNGARDLFYQVNDAKKVHDYLQSLITQDNYPKFDYVMNHDRKWKTTSFLASLLKGKN